MQTLYICEKPSQARDIAAVLGATKKLEHYWEGQGIRVTWCVGHLLEMEPPEYYCPDIKPWRIEKLPVIPKEWILKPIAKTQKQYQAIQKCLRETNHVVIATDADRFYYLRSVDFALNPL